MLESVESHPPNVNIPSYVVSLARALASYRSSNNKPSSNIMPFGEICVIVKTLTAIPPREHANCNAVNMHWPSYFRHKVKTLILPSIKILGFLRWLIV